MNHEVKVKPAWYARISEGSKTFLSFHDRDSIQAGDTLTVREWDDRPSNPAEPGIPIGYTGSPLLTFDVPYVEADGSQAVVTLKPVKRVEKKNGKTRA